MDKDDILLSIVEKIADDLSEAKKDMQAIKVEQVRQGQILNSNTVTLTEHEARSTASEDRIEKLEDFDQFFKNAIMVISAIGGIILFVVEVIPYLSRLVH